MVTVWFVEIGSHYIHQFLAESPSSHLLECYFILYDQHWLVYMSRCTVIYSITPCGEAVTLLPISPPSETTQQQAQISVWIFPPLDRELICLAILPWYPKMRSLTKEDYNKLYEIMHTESTLQSAEGFVSKLGIHTVWPGFWSAPSTTQLWPKAAQKHH